MLPIQALSAAAEPVPGASFGMLDWSVVFVYFIVVLGIGYWTSRSQKSKRDYFLGGREISWWVVGLSIIATETSALTFIGIPALAFGTLKVSAGGVFHTEGGSMLFIMLIIGYVIGRLIIAWKIVPLYFTGDVYTPFQLMKRAFGAESRYVAAALSLLGTALGAGVRVLVTAIPVMIVMRTGWAAWDLNLSILVIMIFALIYTTIGGVKAVVWTDMIQYFIFVLGGLFTVLYIPTLLHGDLAAPSGATGWAAIGEVAGDHATWWNFGVLTSQQVAEKVGGDVTFWLWLKAQVANLFGGDFSFIMGVVPTTIGILLAFGFDQINVQRILSCRNVSDGRRAMILSGVLIFPQFVLFLLIGVCLFAFYKLDGFHFGIMPWDPRTVDPATGLGVPKGDFVFPIFMVSQLPPFLKGFLIAGILAAAMSSVAGALSAMSSIAIMDFFRPLAGEKSSEKKELRFSVVATIISGVVLGIIAYLCKEAELLVNLAFKVAGLTGGPILGAFLFGMWKKRGYGGPVIAGLIVSFCFMIGYNVLRSSGDLTINWPWDTPVGMVVCLAVAYLASIGLPRAEGRDIGSSEHDDV